jgi:branched-chain amino acid transport system substrate-binding protein
MRERPPTGTRSIALGRSPAGTLLTTGARRLAAAVSLLLALSGCSSPDAKRACATHQDCGAVATKDKPYACNPTQHTCEPLLTKECSKLLARDPGGAIPAGTLPDGTLLLGSVLTLTGDDKTGGVDPSLAMELAWDEIMHNGFTSVKSPRGPSELAILECDDASEYISTPDIAAKHLVNDIGVPAIIGGTGTSATYGMAVDFAIPGGTLLFSPSATGVALIDIPDDVGNDLVWQASPSDDHQAKAMATFITELLKNQKTPLDPTTATILCLNANDLYGAGLGGAVVGYLKHGKNLPNIKRFTYNAKSDSPEKVIAKEIKATTIPDVVILVGYGETAAYASEIEKRIATFMNAMKKPIYLFSDGGQDNGLWTAAAANDDFRRRIYGTAAGQNSDDPTFKTFADTLNNKSGRDVANTFGAPGAYDIVYLLALKAARLAARDTPITGAALSAQLKHVTTGVEVKPGAASFKASLAAATGGDDFNYTGASGALQFDEHGQPSGNFQIWCIPPSPDKANPSHAKSSGVFFDTSDTLNGYPPTCN